MPDFYRQDLTEHYTTKLHDMSNVEVLVNDTERVFIDLKRLRPTQNVQYDFFIGSKLADIVKYRHFLVNLDPVNYLPDEPTKNHYEDVTTSGNPTHHPRGLFLNFSVIFDPKTGQAGTEDTECRATRAAKPARRHQAEPEVDEHASQGGQHPGPDRLSINKPIRTKKILHNIWSRTWT